MWINDRNNFLTYQSDASSTDRRKQTNETFWAVQWKVWSKKTISKSTTDLNKHNRTDVNPPLAEFDPPNANTHAHIHVKYSYKCNI